MIKSVKYKQHHIKTVDQIDIKRLPDSAVSNLALKLIDSSVGDSIKIPIIVAKGSQPGPVFGITAAVHGNEVNGIPVIHELFKGIRPNRLKGTIIGAIVVNVPGFQTKQRLVSQGVDLNHMMPGKKGGNFGEIYAHRVMSKLVCKMDFVADLHTASLGRINSLYIRANLRDRAAAEMAYLQRPEIIVHNPPSDYTLRGAAQELGIPAITIEIGDPSRFQYKYIKRSLVGIRSILGHLGMINYVPPKAGFSEPIICEKSSWIYTDSGGILTVFPGITDIVEKGQQIAQLANIYGGKYRDYLSPAKGIVIGKAVDPVAETGCRVLHLGIEAKAGSRLRQHLHI